MNLFFSAGFEGEGRGRRLTGTEVFLNWSARKETFCMCFERKNKKNGTDLLRAERQHLKANCIAIPLSCKEAILVILEKWLCACAEMLAVLSDQETQGCLPLGSFPHEAAFHLTVGRVQYLLRELLKP